MEMNQCAETPMSDHVARFWRHLEMETVRILVDMKRTVGTEAPDGPVEYWDSSSFSDDVAKELVAERDHTSALWVTETRENERLRNALLPCLGWLEYAYRNVDSPTSAAVKAHLPAIREALDVAEK